MIITESAGESWRFGEEGEMCRDAVHCSCECQILLGANAVWSGKPTTMPFRPHLLHFCNAMELVAASPLSALWYQLAQNACVANGCDCTKHNQQRCRGEGCLQLSVATRWRIW